MKIAHTCKHTLRVPILIYGDAWHIKGIANRVKSYRKWYIKGILSVRVKHVRIYCKILDWRDQLVTKKANLRAPWISKQFQKKRTTRWSGLYSNQVYWSKTKLLSRWSMQWSGVARGLIYCRLPSAVSFGCDRSIWILNLCVLGLIHVHYKFD